MTNIVHTTRDRNAMHGVTGGLNPDVVQPADQELFGSMCLLVARHIEESRLQSFLQSYPTPRTVALGVWEFCKSRQTSSEDCMQVLALLTGAIRDRLERIALESTQTCARDHSISVAEMLFPLDFALAEGFPAATLARLEHLDQEMEKSGGDRNFDVYFRLRELAGVSSQEAGAWMEISEEELDHFCERHAYIRQSRNAEASKFSHM